ncbi:MAG: glycoside hydrolase [Candidatus Pacebacteria bacterium]|nr:glycoside hydrolase [Candidatus Paceibacterota bacterium]
MKPGKAQGNKAIIRHTNLPIVDISGQTKRHVFVARGNDTEWNGHPSTVLLPDGKTIFCVWQARRDGTRQHGAPGGYMKRSDDGGKTWSDYLDLPANWREIGRGSPTIHRLVDGRGTGRLFVFCRDQERTTFLIGVSEDGGATWSELRPIGLALPEDGPITGWTAPITILEATVPDGRRKHLMWYERTRNGQPSFGVIWQSASYDGGLTWCESRPVVDKAGSCEPACVRSPDGKQLLLLIREQNREMNLLMATSDDEGETWSSPRELPLALTGDRHLPRYAPHGRLVIVFRPVPPGEAKTLSAFPDDYFTAWVGRYEDIVTGREGESLIRLLRSYRGADHTYPGLELLPDGTFVATTYIQYRPDELQSIISVRFRLDEVQSRADK